jgi:hypothetical protein
MHLWPPPRRRPGPNWETAVTARSPSSATSPNWAPAFAGVVLEGGRGGKCGRTARRAGQFPAR